MKLLVFLIGLFIFLQGGSIYAYSSQDARQELVQIAKEVKRKDDAIRLRRELDNRVEAEAKRLGVASVLSSRSVIRDILSVFGDKADVALAVAKAESGLRCEAYHFNQDKAHSVDHGAMQLNDYWWKWGNINDCAENIRIAKRIVDETGNGWNNWVQYTNGAYLKYL